MVRKNIPRNYRRIDSHPCRNVHRGYVVGTTSEGAPNTRKFVSTRSVLFTFVSTHRTDMRSPSGVYNLDGDTYKSGFVFDERSQLSEAPRTMVVSLGLPNRGPCTNALEVFEGNHTLRVSGSCHNILGDAMISISLEPGLLPGQSFEVPLGIFGPDGLEDGTEFHALPPNSVDPFTVVGIPVTVHCEINNTKVDTESTNTFNLIRFGDFDNDTQIKSVLDEYEVCLSTDNAHTSSMILTHEDRDPDAAIEGQDGNSIEALPSEDTLVVDHGSVGFELGLNGLIELVCFDGLGDGTNGHLRR